MDQYIIKGGNPLVGEVEIGGAKNAALAILAAAIMTDDTVRLENLPDVNDINVLLEAIGGIGAKVERVDRHTAVINGSTIGDISVDYEYIKKIRASYYLLGALLGKYKKAEVPLPGGCNIGSRPIDLHLKGFRALGATVDIKYGAIVASAPDGLHGTHIFMDTVSVGATINIMTRTSPLLVDISRIFSIFYFPHIVPVIHGVLAELGHLLYKETLQRDHYHRVEKFGNSGINVFLNPSILSIYNDKALCIGFEEFKYTFIQKA